MTRAEVARAFRVDPSTVDNWRRDGNLPGDAVVQLPGGGFRYRRRYVVELLSGAAS